VSASATIAALQSFLAAQPAPLNVQTYRFSPPWPYEGTYPYVFILPRTQQLVPVGGVSDAWEGWWRLVWVNTVDTENDNTDQLMERCATFAEALRTTLAASAQSRQLNSPGLIACAGWNPDGGGAGIIVDWDGRYRGLDTNSVPFWAIPIDIWVQEQPDV
jgi:hypothetical protein